MVGGIAAGPAADDDHGAVRSYRLKTVKSTSSSRPASPATRRTPPPAAPPGDQRRHPPQRGLLLGEAPEFQARLGAGDRRRHQLGEAGRRVSVSPAAAPREWKPH